MGSSDDLVETMKVHEWIINIEICIINKYKHTAMLPLKHIIRTHHPDVKVNKISQTCMYVWCTDE